MNDDQGLVVFSSWSKSWEAMNVMAYGTGPGGFSYLEDMRMLKSTMYYLILPVVVGFAFLFLPQL
jgi:hypothetical protein